MYELRTVKFDAAAMDTLLRSPGGSVGLHMKNIGVRIVVMAKRLCGNETGRLSKSIQMSQARVAGGQLVRVFSNVRYAYYVHEGTRAHVIDPTGMRIMVFQEAGRRVYAQKVIHPGTRGKYYLTIPLKRVVH